MKLRNTLLFLLVLLVVAAGFLMPRFLPAAVKEGGTLEASMVDIPLTKDPDDLWRWSQFGKYLDGRGLYEITDITYRYSSEALVAYSDSFAISWKRWHRRGSFPLIFPIKCARMKREA